MDMDVQLHSFLKDLSKPQLAALSKIAITAQFKAGKPIFLQGESADRFFLIEQGRVSLDYGLPRKRHVQIQTIGPGEALGQADMAGADLVAAAAFAAIGQPMQLGLGRLTAAQVGQQLLRLQLHRAHRRAIAATDARHLAGGAGGRACGDRR